MKRPLLALACLGAVLAVAAPAQAAAPSCTRGKAKLLAAGGDVNVVSVRTRKETQVYGCWTPTGRRFVLFQSEWFGVDDEADSARFEIVDGRYIGAIRQFGGGVSVSRSAVTWDVRKRVMVHDTKPCNNTSPAEDDETIGIEEAAFFHGGGIAYTCWTVARIADAKGDRALPDAGITGLAISSNGSGDRLYYMLADTPKWLAI
jgi:hypothetical protein